MSGAQQWIGGALYAAAAAVYGVWFLREWHRNETLQDRIAEMVDVFGLFAPEKFIYRALIIAQVAFWPLPVLTMIVFDVPGHGKNIDEPKAGDQ